MEENEIEVEEKEAAPEGVENENTPEGDPQEGAAGTAEESTVVEGEEEIVISIGEEDPQAEEEKKAPQWVKELRKRSREDQRRIRELEEKLKSVVEPESILPPLGKKPTIEDAEFDAEVFEKQLETWYDRKAKHDAEAARIEQQKTAQQREWQAKLETYAQSKQSMKVVDYEEAEQAVQDMFSQEQQGIIIHSAEVPAHVVYALGKSPSKAKELASIKDPVKFAHALGKLEAKMTVTTRKPESKPEPRVPHSGKSVSSVVSGEEEKLLKEAMLSGDMTKYRAFKRDKRENR